MKLALKIAALVVGLLLVVAAGYLAYLFLSYQRVADDKKLTVHNQSGTVLGQKEAYTVTTFNIGYGAYPQDYSFFMDGGKYSRAYDKKTVEQNLAGIKETLQELNSDFILLQEVDIAGDRSYHVDQAAYFTAELSEYSHVFGQNYDSAYLFYPLLDPIGKAKSGLLTLSRGEMLDSRRYSLPIETNFNKFFDLDRAFTLTRIKVGAKTLSLINVHLSAFTKDQTILDDQIKKLARYMEQEYQEGNGVIVGGDYNHDVLGNSSEVFDTDDKVRTWTHPFPTEFLPTGFSLATDGLKEARIPSVRANGTGYEDGVTFVSLIDGFIVSDNLTVKSVQVSDLKFEHSDHNPVTMTFSWQE